jgi:hypothetical protein
MAVGVVNGIWLGAHRAARFGYVWILPEHGTKRQAPAGLPPGLVLSCGIEPHRRRDNPSLPGVSGDGQAMLIRQRPQDPLLRRATPLAKTERGTKIVSVPGYTRKGPNGPIKVGPHKRSTPN